MRTYTKFKEYCWLVNTLRRAGRLSLAEINDKWLDTEMSEGVELARSTFNRHKAAIEEMFDIIIDCDVYDGYRYYIANPEVLRDDSVQNWMLSTLSVNNVVSESLSLQERILLESAPVEGDLLKDVIRAMQTSRKIEVSYRRYGASESKTMVMEPYCVKLFKRRWYVLGHIHRDATETLPENDFLGMFSFDRMDRLRLTEETFTIDPDFDAEAFFSECYGVIVGDGTQVKNIVIRAFGKQRYYLRDLPLHHSQELIGEGENYSDFRLRVRPTQDFIAQIMSFGNYVKVLQPQSLAQEVAEKLKAAALMYTAE